MEIKPILSILIPSTVSRKEMTDKLINEIHEQSDYENVEVVSDWHPTNCVGVKRNYLLSQASGEYIVFVDSDDKISPNYVSLILQALETCPDCVGINGIITTNGYDQRRWFISKEYGHWFTGDDGNYYRTPNHISPVKRELALKAGFPDISFGEDAVYSQRLLPFLKTEVLISEPIYHYDYWQK